MAVTAAAQAVMMALLHSSVGGYTSRAAGLCTRHARELNDVHLPSSRLVPAIGAAAAQRTLTVAAAAAEPGSRRRKGKAQTPQHQEQQQHTQQDTLAASEQPQPDAASQQQDKQVQEQQQQQQQQQEQRSRQLLWDTAAQLGLKRGSEIATPASAAAAAADQSADCSVDAGSSDDDLTGSSSSSSSTTTASSRRRRSRASTSSNGSRLHTNTAASSSISSSSSLHLDSNSSTLDQDDGSASDSPADSIRFSSRDDAVVAAIARLGRFLDFRERCASEVLTKLAALGYDGQLAQRVLQELQTAGLQSDARFAEMFARGSWRTKAQSPARLAYELRSRGVAQEHIDAAMAAVFGPGRQLPSRDAACDKEAEMWEQLVEMCRRRAELTKAESKQKRRAKLAGWLQRRGHNMSTVFRVFDAVGI